LGRRFNYYFNHKILKEAGFSLICRALLKYGHENFKLEIIEYCTLEVIVEREQYWISELSPSYNLVTVVDGSFTYNHTEEARQKMSLSQKARFADPENRKQLDELHDKWAKSSENTAQLIEAQRLWWAIPENREKSLPFLKRKKVKVFDLETKTEKVYPSLTEAALQMGCARSTLNYWLKDNKSKAPIKGKFTIVLVGEFELSE
jgi:group I intron endonuclease